MYSATEITSDRTANSAFFKCDKRICIGIQKEILVAAVTLCLGVNLGAPNVVRQNFAVGLLFKGCEIVFLNLYF